MYFTGLEVYSLRECLLSTVRLAEACSKALVKLWYSVLFHREPIPLLLVQKR